MESSAPTRPLSQFVLKLHSRCDLACDHCYVYEHADTSWKQRIRATPDEVFDRVAARIAEHAAAHHLDAVQVVFHGGEPLLAGPARIRRAAEALRGALDGRCALELGIQTNAVLLNERFCDIFDEFGISVGVSLDGGRAENDRHRRFADGRSSYDRVVRSIGLLREPRYRHLYGGLLCTIDVDNDPLAVYDALMALEPPRIDFLLPHATHDVPPVRPGGAPAPYADWLLTIHRRWTAQGRPVPVRVFDSVRRMLRGGSSLVESIGTDPVDLVVIETDGTFEQADSLKTAYDGAPATGMDVFTHSLDEVAAHPGITARRQGRAGLAEECRRCPVVDVCGGGLYAHRYRTGNGFANPSAYCADLMELILGIRDAEDEEVDREISVTTAPGQQDGSSLTEEQIDQLAAGYGDAGTVAALAAEQLGITRGLLTAVWERAPRDARTAAVWRVLAEVDEAAPEAVDTVLAHPYVRPWARHCLETGGDGGADVAGLAEVAAASLVRSAGRYGATVRVPVRDGAVRLPGLGRVLVGAADGEEAEVAADAGGFRVSAAGRTLRIAAQGPADAWWHPVRRVGPAGWTVALEDTDPYRDAHQWPPVSRQDESEVKAWHEDLVAAWDFLGGELPRYVPGLAAGLGTITPLVPPGDGSDVSGAARQAFGAVGIARPATPVTLALLVAHEFQHVKLGAVLDLMDLFDPDDTRLFHAPWRPDPRPLEGLLQGTYAHIAVAEYWRALARRGVPEAAAPFARWTRETAEAVDRLAGSGSLTPLGERFAARMAGTVAPWLSEVNGV
ncbi:FxsB family cyclophane-forming radical SAM/SPASM peptide maturase [Streptomyces sp. NPDC088354]|uniref:FxsB family cyclophane-forming radical SAM/SPASM peptide maturase n=1 Tax=Streptomyces sp. NPDC088354 TaxID=3365856 RepID=UPI003826367D